MSANPFRRFLDRQGFVVLDGGLATALETAGHRLTTALWSARLLVDDPDAIRAVHAAYLEAGADCVSTASYQASFDGFAAAGIGAEEAEALLRRSVALAVEARKAFWSQAPNRAGRTEPLVAATAGPYGAFLADGSEYDGRYGVTRDALASFHARRLDVLADTEADLIAFETIPSSLEAGVIADLLGRHADTWAWITFTCRDVAGLWDGTSIEEAVSAVASARGLAAVGVNCTAPPYVAELIDRVRSVTDLPVIAYPNSGEAYDAATRAWSGLPAGDAWLAAASGWAEHGARVIGGCCRVGPPIIRSLREQLERAFGRTATPWKESTP